MTEEERKKGLNHMKEVRRKVQEKWESTGFLDGLEGHIKENMTILMENQENAVISENPTGMTKEWDGVYLPIVKHVFKEQLADQIHTPLAIHVAKQLSGHTF